MPECPECKITLGMWERGLICPKCMSLYNFREVRFFKGYDYQTLVDTHELMLALLEEDALQLGHNQVTITDHSITVIHTLNWY